MRRVYADHNATSPLRKEARDAMVSAMDVFGNPSSVHLEGRNARGLVETAREQVAEAIKANPKDIIFTSGGTESANLGAMGLFAAQQVKGHATSILYSALEHDAVRKSAEFLTDQRYHLPVTPDGEVCLDGLSELQTQRVSSPVLCLTLANNETGVIQPVQEAANRVRHQNGLVFCDGVQALGKIPVNVNDIGADVIGFSSHKVGGPQGVGAVWIKPGLDLPAHIHGGGQESGKRSGTHNVIGIVGFGAATQAAANDLPTCAETMCMLRDALQTGLKQKYPDALVFGDKAKRLPNTLCIALDAKPAETRIIALDLAGIAASAGSACSSGKTKTSGVIEAMGYDTSISKSAIRFSLGHTTSGDDIKTILDKV